MAAAESLMDLALKYLNRQDYSEQKLAERLTVAGFSKAEISECLTRLKKWGYLDDRKFGVNRIQQLQGRFKSRSYTVLDLENHGLQKSLVAELVSSYYPEERELEIARELLLKKSNRSKNQSKMWNYLLRAGFSENTLHYCFPGIDPT